METLGFFTSDYSLSSSILNLEKVEDCLVDGPESIIKICVEEKIKDLYLCESNFSSFVTAYKNSEANNLNLHYGLKIILVNDMGDKTPDSLNTESKIIISSAHFIDSKQRWISCAASLTITITLNANI